jgi:hypothetical protein
MIVGVRYTNTLHDGDNSFFYYCTHRKHCGEKKAQARWNVCVVLDQNFSHKDDSAMP